MRKIKADLRENKVSYMYSFKKGIHITTCIIETEVTYSDVFARRIRNYCPFNCFQVKVMGHAYCSKDDMYDRKLGERLAESRAKVELYRRIRNFIAGYRQTLLFEKADLDLQKARYESMIGREKGHIEWLKRHGDSGQGKPE